MTLGDKQEKFAEMVMLLLIWLHHMGYKVRLGHAMRCQNCKVGIANSEHKKKLAIDINLFKDGKYLTRTEDHLPPGEYWESIGGRWGGRLTKPDGNHYQFE